MGTTPGETKLVKGTAVVSLGNGAKLGNVDHVFLDPERKRIVGFSFHQGGLFGKTSGVIDIDDVHGIGADAVTIDDVSAVRSELVLEAKGCELIDLDDLLGRKVITAGGSFVGKVAAVRFGESSHALVSLEVEEEDRKEHRQVPAERIEQLGSELIVVAEAVERRAVQHLVRVA